MTEMVTVKNRWGGTTIRESRSMENNPRWKGGLSTCPDGRVKIKSPTHPNASHDGYVYRYRLVMEAYIGRYLRTDEIIHHRNGNPSDDRLENLELTNDSLHRSNHLLDKVSSDGGYDARIEKKCRLCGIIKPRTEFSPDDKLNSFSRGSACRKCAACLQRQRRVFLRQQRLGLIKSREGAV